MDYLDSDSYSSEGSLDIWNIEVSVPFRTTDSPNSVYTSRDPVEDDGSYLPHVSALLEQQESSKVIIQIRQGLAKLRELHHSLAVLRKFRPIDSPHIRTLEAHLKVLERQFLESVSETFSVNAYLDLSGSPGETNLQLMSRLMAEEDAACGLKGSGLEV
ncbi:hypothetical protein ONS95_012113 [Cadophora gregata]|uniref:uncharacterized protein n=1 Tax=Cadophora gregata TaxID=51156 RepID=UPI0026DDC92F|nr:uncharacterized protein ONS95_012113 [Cadophora gregata]KAK0117787.1 hypothetical protein ONS95_012113 [Cadophora gregata]KAK0122838.1 hypothetical protein ONS96_009868 [Cadophora gregata f. sp. sojae]